MMLFRAKPRTSSTITRSLLALLAAQAALACSATADREGWLGYFGGDSGNHGSGGADAGSGGNGGTGEGESQGAGGDDISLDVGDGGTALDEESACAATSSVAEEVSLDLIVLLDRSGSMYGQNWNGATAALKQFVQDPASSGVNVGILYFPIDSPPDGVVCNQDHYKDLDVPLGPLPQNAPALVQSIDWQDPNGGSTPMYGALFGTLLHATAQKDQNPTHKVVVILASDGDPNSCPGGQNDIASIAGLAKSALDYNGVETYAVAISGASVFNLDQIAAAGGTTKAYDVTQNITEFTQKMGEIRANALACEYLVPKPPGSEPLDPEKVLVKHVDAAGLAVEIPRSQDKSACGSSPGWYYDDPLHPTTLELCPASCDAAEKDPLGKINVLFGCRPKLN